LSLISICQQVAGYIPVAIPAFIVNNPDETAMLLLACAQDEGDALARRPQGGWVNMIREFDFTTASVGPVNGVVTNNSPVVTGLSLSGTWDSGGNWDEGGTWDEGTSPLVANSWYVFGTGAQNNTIIKSIDSATQITLNQNIILSGAVTQTVQLTFGKSDYDLPADFERPIDNTFWDRSRFWAMRGPQSPQQWQLYKSSVIGRASIQRRYRFRRINNAMKFSIDPVPLDNGSALVFEYVSTGWCESQTGVVQNSWMNDNDVGVLDEYLMRLGIRWRMLRRLGMSYQEELNEYERQVDKAVAHDGAAAILNLTPSDSLTIIGPWNLPETNFGGVTGT